MKKAMSSFPEDHNKIVNLFVDDQQNNLNSFTTYFSFKTNKKYLIITANSAEEASSILKVASVADDRILRSADRKREEPGE